MLAANLSLARPDVERLLCSTAFDLASADTTAPVATLSNAGGSVNGNVTVQSSVALDVGVTWMCLFINGENGELVGSTNGSSLSYLGNTREICGGKHTVVLEAEDSAGSKGSRSVSVNR